MTNSRKVLLIFLAALALGLACLFVLSIGCQPPEFKVQAKEIAGKTIIDFTTKKFYLFKGFVEENEYVLNDFEVWRIDKDRRRLELCWKLKALPGGDLHLKSMEYGKIPVGFQEVQAAKPLEINGIYELTHHLDSGGFVFLKDKHGISMLPKYGYLRHYLPNEVCQDPHPYNAGHAR